MAANPARTPNLTSTDEHSLARAWVTFSWRSSPTLRKASAPSERSDMRDGGKVLRCCEVLV